GGGRRKLNKNEVVRYLRPNEYLERTADGFRVARRDVEEEIELRPDQQVLLNEDGEEILKEPDGRLIPLGEGRKYQERGGKRFIITKKQGKEWSDLLGEIGNRAVVVRQGTNEVANGGVLTRGDEVKYKLKKDSKEELLGYEQEVRTENGKL